MIGWGQGAARRKGKGTGALPALLEDPGFDVRGEGTGCEHVWLHGQLVVIPEGELSHAWNGCTRKPQHLPMVYDQPTHQWQAGYKHGHFARVLFKHVPYLGGEVDPEDAAVGDQCVDERKDSWPFLGWDTDTGNGTPGGDFPSQAKIQHEPLKHLAHRTGIRLERHPLESEVQIIRPRGVVRRVGKPRRAAVAEPLVDPTGKRFLRSPEVIAKQVDDRNCFLTTTFEGSCQSTTFLGIQRVGEQLLVPRAKLFQTCIRGHRIGGDNWRAIELIRPQPLHPRVLVRTGLQATHKLLVSQQDIA